MFLTIESQNAFSTLLYMRENIVEDHRFGKFSTPNDTPRDQPGGQVRQRGGELDKDEPPVIPTEDELPMVPYSVASRRFQDNLTRSANYTNMSLDYMMEKMHFPRPSHFLVSYPYVPSWEEL
ncbi:unnamed protein product [Lactuca saligna]|uniref:Uncharacterized protein n=1 Tax=Lactuca saligna TaxID=75948 RepID=A0AA35Z9V5_LACSI|nr:unnamed protein product [Lactuca saligna]